MGKKWLDNGDFYLTNFDANNHYEDNIKIIEKFDEHKVWTAVLYDADQQGYPYLKRFTMEATKRKQNYVSDNPASRLVALTDEPYPRFLVTFGGRDAFRGTMEIEAEQFVGVKGFKAKGKRITNWETESIEQLEPAQQPEQEPEDSTPEEQPAEETPQQENLDPDAGKSQQQVIDEITGQLSLFNDNEDN